LAFNEPIRHMQPLAADWNLMCVKSVLVNMAPTLPVMLCLIKKPQRGTCQCAAIWVYCMLGINMSWTLLFLPVYGFDPTRVVNGVCGVSLCISLIIHNIALCKRGFTLFEVHGDIIYGYGISLSWLVCHTVWDTLFILEDNEVGSTLHLPAWWAMMFFFYYHSDGRSSVENYSAMARCINLSMYLATSTTLGLFSSAQKPNPLGVDTQRQPYFLFLAVLNAIYSFYVILWEFCLLLGCNGADKYFRLTFDTHSLKEKAEQDSSHESYEESNPARGEPVH